LFGSRGIQAASVLEVIYLLLSLAVKEFTQTLYFNIGNSLLMLCINLGGDFVLIEFYIVWYKRNSAVTIVLKKFNYLLRDYY
jgi:hypothetical protein